MSLSLVSFGLHNQNICSLKLSIYIILIVTEASSLQSFGSFLWHASFYEDQEGRNHILFVFFILHKSIFWNTSPGSHFIDQKEF